MFFLFIISGIFWKIPSCSGIQRLRNGRFTVVIWCCGNLLFFFFCNISGQFRMVLWESLAEFYILWGCVLYCLFKQFSWLNSYILYMTVFKLCLSLWQKNKTTNHISRSKMYSWHLLWDPTIFKLEWSV